MLVKVNYLFVLTSWSKERRNRDRSPTSSASTTFPAALYSLLCSICAFPIGHVLCPGGVPQHLLGAQQHSQQQKKKKIKMHSPPTPRKPTLPNWGQMRTSWRQGLRRVSRRLGSRKALRGEGMRSSARIPQLEWAAEAHLTPPLWHHCHAHITVWSTGSGAANTLVLMWKICRSDCVRR